MDIVILDVQGKIMLQQSGLLDQEGINISGYAPGSYFVKIITPELSRQIRFTKK